MESTVTYRLMCTRAAADPVAKHFHKVSGRLSGIELVNTKLHLTAPVRVLRGGAGKVLLGAFFGEVFLIHLQQHGWGGCQESDDSVVQFSSQFRDLSGGARIPVRKKPFRKQRV